MALFFDQKWFNAALEAAGLTKPKLALALGLSEQELSEMWKDQREITESEIGTIALLLGASEKEVRNRGGVQGSAEARAAMKAKRQPETSKRTEGSVEERLNRLEEKYDAILKELKRRD